MVNRVVLVGRLCTDPEMKYTPNGVAVTNFILAVDRNHKNQDGESEADFVPIVAWKQSAEFAANYLTKGRLVAVDGRLQIRKWVANDGSKRTSAEVVVENLRSLDKPKEHGNSDGHASSGAVVRDDAGFDDPFADE